MKLHSEPTIIPTNRPPARLRLVPLYCVSILCVIGLLLITSSSVVGQTGLSVLRGTINDQSGAVVPDAEISVTELATNIKVRTIRTDSNGGFEIPDLKPGSYRLRAEKIGFKPFVADDLLLDSGQTRRVEIVLQVGGTTEEVTVKAGAGVITTDTGTIGGGFDKSKFQSTPLVDLYPSPFAMLSTQPSVQGNGWDLRVSGQGRTQYSQGFDGVDNDMSGEQSNNFNFFQEATVVTVNATADSSRLGRYNLVSKRGQNQWHFMGYYKHFNSGLNSRFFFDPQKTPFIQHEWQAEASGPIIKDKTFFYFSWMQQRIPLGSFKRASVPTQKMRNGDFSEFAEVIIDPRTGNQFDGNKIPLDRINSVSSKLQELYIPTPNLAGPNPFTSNFGWADPFDDDFNYLGDWPFLRIDHQLTANNQIFGRWLRRKTPYVLPLNLPLLSWTRLRDHRQLVIGDTHVFSPSLINTFTFGRSTDFIEDGLEQAGFTPINGAEAISQIGLQGINPAGYRAAGFPAMKITGITELSTVPGGVKSDDSILSFEDNITWSKGRHVWKFGGQYHAYRTFSGTVPDYGTFTFDGAFTGNPYADFLLGLPRESERLDPLVNRGRKAKELGLFIMDTFKVTQNLTLDLGLRWDYYTVPMYEDGLIYNFDLETGNVIVPQAALAQVSPLYPKTINIVTGDPQPRPDRKNFRPRLSFAYRIGDRNDFVVRGGYGAFTERIDYFERVSGSGPYRISEKYNNRFVGGEPLFAFPSPFPSSLASAEIPSQSVTAFPFETRNGTIHQFNISIEREIHQIGLRVSYIGSRGRGLNYRLEEINKPRPFTTQFTDDRRPYPQLASVEEYRADGAARYDSLQLEAKRRVGFATFQAHWTWSNNVNNFSNTENPYDVTSNWSKDEFTRRHYAVINTTFDLPFGKGRKYLATAPGVVDHLLGGWQLQTISYFGSGTFFSPKFSGFDVSNTNTFEGIPDRIGNGNLPRDQRKVERWFDASAFKIPGCPDSEPVCTADKRQNVGRFGNAGFNILEGPGLNVHHLSLAKQFRLTERLSFNFSSSISNLFNRPHFNKPDFNSPEVNISTQGVGIITSTVPDYAPEKHAHRVIIFKARFEF
jgi:Carboxypeptidase regulatory-like domain/TonB dependent receptor